MLLIRPFIPKKYSYPNVKLFSGDIVILISEFFNGDVKFSFTLPVVSKNFELFPVVTETWGTVKRDIVSKDMKRSVSKVTSKI